MLHNHERLLVKLVEQYYGRLASHAAELLLNFEEIPMKRATLKNSRTPFSGRDFRRGVETLVKLNLAKYSCIIKRQKVVRIDKDRILNILFYPQYIALVGERFQTESRHLLKTLILYGNLNTNDLIERTLHHICMANCIDIQEDTLKPFIEGLYENFKQLVEANVFVRVEDSTFGSEANGIGGYGFGQKAKKKSPALDKDCDVNTIFRSLQSWAGSESRNQFRPSTSSSSSSKKRKEEEVEEEWTFNIDILNYYLFIKMFPTLLNQQFTHKPALELFKLLLELTMKKSPKLGSEIVAEIDFSEVIKEYRDRKSENTDDEDGNKEGERINPAKLPQTLTMFAHFIAPNLVQTHQQTCKLNIAQFIDEIVIVIINEFVRKNFGENAVRIFGALREKSCVFENALLYELKMDSREFHKNLYQLDQHRIVNMSFFSEASQSAASAARNVRRAFSVDLQESVDYILKRCFYSLYTSTYRKSIEMTSHKDLIRRKDTIEVFKKDIESQDLEGSDKVSHIQSAHSLMSDNDHRKADAILGYEKKVEHVNFLLANYVFLFSLWKRFNPADKYEDDGMDD